MNFYFRIILLCSPIALLGNTCDLGVDPVLVFNAIRDRDKGLLQELIDKDISVLEKTNDADDTPLLFAIKDVSNTNDQVGVEIISALAEKMLALNQRDRDGNSPLALVFDKAFQKNLPGTLISSLTNNGALWQDALEKYINDEQAALTRNTDKDTPLLFGIKTASNLGYGIDDQMVCQLAKQKAALDEKDSDNQSPLALAFNLAFNKRLAGTAVTCLAQNLEEKQLKEGLEGFIHNDENLLTITNGDNDTPLLFSIKNIANKDDSKGVKIACLLAAKRKALDQKDRDQKSPLALAFDRKLPGALKCIAKYGASLSEKVFDGMEPLVWSIQEDKPNFRATFVENIAKDDKALIEDVSPLVWTIQKGMPKIAKELLDKGVDPNYGGISDKIPIFTALDEKQSRIALMLLNNKDIKLDVREKDTDNTLLHKAVRNDKIVLELIARGVDVNALNREQQNPLHVAYILREFGTAELLKGTNVDQNKVDIHGKKPSEYAFNWAAADISLFGDLTIYSNTCRSSDNDCNEKKAGQCFQLFKLEDQTLSNSLKQGKSMLEEAINKIQRTILLQLHPDKCNHASCATKTIAFNNCFGKSVVDFIPVWKCSTDCDEEQRQCFDRANSAFAACSNKYRYYLGLCHVDQNSDETKCTKKRDSCRVICHQFP